MTHRLALPILVAATLAAGACSDDPATPTSASVPEEPADAASRLFTGTLSPRGSAFYSFTLPQESDVFLTLASVAPTSGRGALSAPLTLGLGVPRGTGCAVSTAVLVAADLAAQIREVRQAGVHCASIADGGILAGEVVFAVRIGYFQ